MEQHNIRPLRGFIEWCNCIDYNYQLPSRYVSNRALQMIPATVWNTMNIYLSIYYRHTRSLASLSIPSPNGYNPTPHPTTIYVVTL